LEQVQEAAGGAPGGFDLDGELGYVWFRRQFGKTDQWQLGDGRQFGHRGIVGYECGHQRHERDQRHFGYGIRKEERQWQSTPKSVFVKSWPRV
jgi:hypothetical protein